jgi:hypothetical protein
MYVMGVDVVCVLVDTIDMEKLSIDRPHPYPLKG